MTNLLENLPQLSLPPLPPSRIRLESDKPLIFDPLRGRWVALTPEEWVRQHFASWLTGELGYPASRTANEVALTQIKRQRRADTIIYDDHARPYIVVEYKRPTVKITPAVFDQIARYNSVLHAPVLVVSNGLTHYCCRYNADGSYTFLKSVPPYSPQ